MSAFAVWNSTQPAVGSEEADQLDLGILSSSIKPETRRKYEYALKEFRELNLELPISLQKLLRYVRCLVEVSDLNAQSIKKRITALKTLNALYGYSPLDSAACECLKRALQGVDKIRPAPPPKRATVVPNAVLRFFMTLPSGHCGKDELVRDALLVGTSLSLRSGELLGIRADDISLIMTEEVGVKVAVDLGVTKCNRFENVEARCQLTATECSSKGLWCAAHKLLLLKEATAPLVKVFGKIKSFAKSVKGLNRYLPGDMKQTDLAGLLAFTGHSCRRTGAQCQISAEVPREVIRTAARWTQEKMIDVYTEEQLREAAADSAGRIRDFICSPY